MEDTQMPVAEEGTEEEKTEEMPAAGTDMPEGGVTPEA